MSAKEMLDYKNARTLVERLVARTAEDPAAAKQARWLNAEIELAAGAAPKAAALLDAKSKERPEMMLAAEAATAMRQPAPMIPVLRDWVAANPRDATAWRTLANLYGAQNDTLRAVRADAEANVAILDYPAARDRFKAAQELVRQSKVVDHYEASIIDTRARAVEALVKEQAAEPPLK
jgi:predicted Zn-dependent protease